MTGEDRAVRKALVEFLRGGNAHVSVEDAIKDFPADRYAETPEGTEHNAWQQLEHIRITLHDLLNFCCDPHYRELKWPEEYWPKEDAPASAEAWNASVAALKKDLLEFQTYIENPDVDLSAKIPWGSGQTIVREVLLAGDHTSYHVGQLVALRKQMDAWKS